MSLNNEPQLFDKKALLAVGVSIAVILGWQSYMQKKYHKPNQALQIAQEKTKAGPSTTLEQNSNGDSSAVSSVVKPVESVENDREEFVKIDNEFFSAEVSSRGMGLHNFQLKKYSDRENQPVTVGSKQPQFVLTLHSVKANLTDAEPLSLNFQLHHDQGSHLISGEANFGGLKVTRTLEIVPEKYLVHSRVQVSGASDGVSGIQIGFSDGIRQTKGASLFSPTLDHQSVFVISTDGEKREIIDPEKGLSEKIVKFDQTGAYIAAIDNLYFAQALIDKSNISQSYHPVVSADINALTQEQTVRVSYPFIAGVQNFQVSFDEFLGPKSINLLSKVDDRMKKMIDFGFFGLIAEPLLKFMNLLFTWVNNYGIAIVLVTLLVRLLVLPFNMMSYRSMKAMQEIQPMMQAVRERYKDDPQKMNLEVMGLFKQHKVNPLGGCLPVMFQIPVFIALYRVFGNSIELYKAPFAFWIHDLSLKDPFYVLPVLMGGLMFLQQKMTPTTMDPAQAKVLMFLPLVFTLFMVTLPSGLTLYMCVSSLFGIIQQYFFLKQKTRSAAVAQAKA